MASKSKDEIKDIKGADKFEKIYNKTIKSGLVVKFYSNQCKPCKEIHPFLVKLSKKHKDKYTFIQVNVSSKDNDMICSTYNIQELPTIVYLLQGTVRKIVVGSDKKIIKKQFEIIEKEDEESSSESTPLEHSSESYDKYNYSSEDDK